MGIFTIACGRGNDAALECWPQPMHPVVHSPRPPPCLCAWAPGQSPALPRQAHHGLTSQRLLGLPLGGRGNDAALERWLWAGWLRASSSLPQQPKCWGVAQRKCCTTLSFQGPVVHNTCSLGHSSASRSVGQSCQLHLPAPQLVSACFSFLQAPCCWKQHSGVVSSQRK